MWGLSLTLCLTLAHSGAVMDLSPAVLETDEHVITRATLDSKSSSESLELIYFGNVGDLGGLFGPIPSNGSQWTFAAYENDTAPFATAPSRSTGT